MCTFNYIMVRSCEEPSVGALDSRKPGGHMLVKLAVHMSLRLRMSVVTSRAMTSNALTSKTELDGDVAVAVSFGVLSACGGSRITCCVRTMATTVSFILLCFWQSSVPYTKRRSKAILGDPVCKLAFLRPVCILDTKMTSSMQTGLKKSSLHMGCPFCIWDLYLNGTQHIYIYM